MAIPSLYCPIRRQEVPQLPEEIVRQQLIRWMVQTLGYPASLLAVEKSLKQMPHLASKQGQLPERRADLLCFAPSIHPEYALYPLLLIECKAHSITPKCMQQLIGYNHHLCAYFIGIANGTEIKTASTPLIGGTGEFFPGLPSYTDLLESIDFFRNLL